MDGLFTSDIKLGPHYTTIRYIYDSYLLHSDNKGKEISTDFPDQQHN